MHPPPPAAQFFQILTGFLPSAAIHTAATLGIADLLAQGPRPVAELADKTETDPGALYRLLRALASIGIFTETQPRTFALTPMADLLRSDHPQSQRSVAMMIGYEVFRPATELLFSVQSGRPAFDKVFGQPVFSHLAHDPARGKIFDEAMTGIHGPETQPIIQAADFARFATICDVGGGNGSALVEILRAAPRSQGILFDLPDVARRAQARIADAGLAGRCRAESGDFFHSIPAGADCYILRHIIHDWDDTRSTQILRNIRHAAPPHARILIIESVLAAGNDPDPGKWLDLIMLIAPGGLERTAAQFESLLSAANLRLSRVIPTQSPVSIIEATVS